MNEFILQDVLVDSVEKIDSIVLGSKQEWDDNPQGGYTMYRYREVS